MSRSRLVILAAAFGAVVAVLLVAPYASAHAGLRFVAPDEVAMTGSDEVSVWLRNDSDTEVTPTFTANVEDGDGAGSEIQVIAAGAGENENAIAGYGVERYRVHLPDSAADEDVSGELVAAAGSVAPASISLTAGPESDFDYGVGMVITGSLIAAILLIAGSWAIGVRGTSLVEPLPTLGLDFSTSFASTLTAVGALLSTVIAASVLPDETVNLSKESFTALNLLFGVAVVGAGLVYSTFQTRTGWMPKAGDPTRKVRLLQGHVLPLLVACGITAWAVFGELWTLALLVDELGQEQGFSPYLVTVFHIALLVAAVAMLIYTPIRIRSIVKGEEAAEAAPREPEIPADATPEVAAAAAAASAAVAALPAPAAAPPQRISLL